MLRKAKNVILDLQCYDTACPEIHSLSRKNTQKEVQNTTYGIGDISQSRYSANV